MRRLSVSLALDAVVLFGLCGAFIANAAGLPKVHYIPLALAIGLGAISVTLHRPFSSLLAIAAVLAAIGPLMASDQNGLLSYFAVIVLPLVWFCIGKYIDPQRVARFFFLVSVVLLFGLAVELSGVTPDLFPVIGVKLGEEVGQRYGSFAINPLALGYFAAIAGLLAFNVPGRFAASALILSSILLLFFANSRGSIISFFISVAFFAWIAGGKAPRLHLALRAVLYTLIVSALVMANERARSTLDWGADEGNLGRLNQWGFCSAVALQNPLGVGPGAMSPIGIGDEPYIEEGIVKSCDSMLLKVAVEYGVPIAVAYVLLITIVLVRLSRRTRRLLLNGGPTRENINLATCAAVCWGIWLFQLMSQSIESIWIGAVFFAFLGHLYWHTRHSLAIHRKLSTASAVVS